MQRWTCVLVLGPVVAGLLGGSVQRAAAQDEPGRSDAHWGVKATFTPRWITPSEVGIIFDSDQTDVSGSEFRIGVVRGRRFGGEWGVSFVRKPLEKGSSVAQFDGAECLDGVCSDIGRILTTVDAALTGGEIHTHLAFGTIRRRVQIGLELAAGAARVTGHLDETQHSLSVRPNPQPGGRPLIEPVSITTSGVEARELFIEQLGTVPLLRAELGLGVLLAPAVKLRVTGGVAFPGYHVASISAVYLFGAK